MTDNHHVEELGYIEETGQSESGEALAVSSDHVAKALCHLAEQNGDEGVPLGPNACLRSHYEIQENGGIHRYELTGQTRCGDPMRGVWYGRETAQGVLASMLYLADWE